MLSRLLSHKGKKKKENPKANTATNDHINYPLNSNHNLVSGYSSPASLFLFFFHAELKYHPFYPQLIGF